MREKREILEFVLKGELDRYNQLMFYMAQKTKKIVEYCFKEKVPVPKPLVIFNEYTYKKIIGHLFSGELNPSDLYPQLKQIVKLNKVLGFDLELDGLQRPIQQFVEQATDKYFKDMNSVANLNDLVIILKSVNLFPKKIPLWKVENQWYEFFKKDEKKLLKKEEKSISRFSGRKK